MTTAENVAVIYVGNDDPFKDRIYRSGLTFTPGQTRLVPLTLAQRFLRHSDVFKEGEATKPKATKVAGDQGKQPDAQATTDTSTSTEPPKDDTQQVLDQQKQKQDTQRLQEDARFALLDQLDAMDKKALIDWAAINYKQSIHHATGEPKVRDMVKGFVDQYGMP